MFPENQLANTPHEPGVYLMLDKKSAVLYVGKAKDLFKRLSSYAHYSCPNHSKTAAMLVRVASIDTIITRTEKEALILESSLIKKHRPRYNIILRDDKSYPMIKVTVQEQWPQVMMTRRKKKDGARYFGPYSDVSAMWATLKLIAKLFPLRRCKGSELKPRSRPCLNHQMGRCLAPCFGKVDKETYQRHVDGVLLILEGKNRELKLSLQQKMEMAAMNLEFEDAAQLRDTIAALDRTLEKQVIVADHKIDQDVVGFHRQGTAVALAVLFVRDGVVNGSRNYFLQDPYGDDPAILAQVIMQLYDADSSFPKEILLPFLPEDNELLSERLGDLACTTMKLLTPQKGDRQALLSIATTNARLIFAEKEKQKQSWETLAETMVEKLRLQNMPSRIECLDISNISGQLAVGSLVVFTDGEPDTSQFRHYRIRTIDGPDDYAMMREVLLRRLSKSRDENTLPDLMLVDGGRGQLGIALGVAEDLGIMDKIDWIGIAKERDEEGEKLYKPNRKNPVLLPRHNPVLLYLMRIRDEAHRYGITFHRRLRKNSTFASEIRKIPGVGSDRHKLLLRHFGSLKQLRAASLDQLQEVAGIGPMLAQHIYQYFHPDELNQQT